MFAFPEYAAPYPQQQDWKEVSWLDRFWYRRIAAPWQHLRVLPWQLQRFSKRVQAHTDALAGLSAAEAAADLKHLRRELRKQGFQQSLVARVFAHVREASGQHLGMRHLPTQLKGGYLLLHGYLTEMDTGEGKTLTATLAAATAALAGLAVHVVTVNDYLAQRDAEQLSPLFNALGLSVGLVLEEMTPEQKRLAYQADIVYCTNKILVFDYLRDRLALDNRSSSLAMSLKALISDESSGLLLRGLQYAIVDEADSVFIDEARTPLIISRGIHDETLEAFYRQALAMAEALEAGEDFNIDEKTHAIRFSNQGLQRLETLAAEAGELLQAANRRQEIVLQALTALHVFQRDIHYIVRDDKVMLVDENTGRIMADRSWEHGLQQLVEIKEGVAISPEKETLGRISYQLFFRRYLRLSGMSGTLREVGGEVREVYGVGVVRVAPFRRSRRRQFASAIHADADSRWQAVIDAIRRIQADGRPVLVGTRSIAASEHLSRLLEAAGMDHKVLNAKHDAGEAEIIAEAGQPGRITIATNMAGRGTDIRLPDIVSKHGGLHVIATERHDNARVDRQLAGRCARQGDPGSWQFILSLDDELVKNYLPSLNRLLRRWLKARPHQSAAQYLAHGYYLLAQRRMQRHHAKIRQRLLQHDFRTRNALSFTGEME